jgi:hypothetical protein
VVIERVDDHSECDGVLPTYVPAPIEVTLQRPYGGCGGAFTDGTGHLAVGLDSHGHAPPSHRLFAPDGRVNVEFGPRVLVAQPDGWIGVDSATRRAPYGEVVVEALAPDGRERRRDTLRSEGALLVDGWRVLGDPAGGALLVWTAHAYPVTTPPTCASAVVRYDARGERLSSVSGAACVVYVVGVSTRGEALIIGSDVGRATTVMWLARDGQTVAGPTTIALGDFRVLEPLLDGSFAVRTFRDGRVARIGHLGTTIDDTAPPWLAARAQQPFALLPDRRGYAVYPRTDAASPKCPAMIELLAPSGRRCGTVTVRDDGGACTTGPLNQGWDGTIVQKVRADECTYRWWPRLLGGD